MSDINVLRKLFEKTGNYIQQPIDISVCGVNLRLPTSRILAELFFACWRCTENHRKDVEIRGVYCPVFNSALCYKFSISSCTHDRHIMIICVIDISVFNAPLLRNRHGKGRKWVVMHKI